MESISKDSSKFFEKGNKAAGVRARKSLQVCGHTADIVVGEEEWEGEGGGGLRGGHRCDRKEFTIQTRKGWGTDSYLTCEYVFFLCHVQNLKKLSQELRVLIQESKRGQTAQNQHNG